MSLPVLSVREIQESDIDAIADYWCNADSSFLVGMGVDLNKLPARKELKQMLGGQLNTPYEAKSAYCIIWQIDQQPIGHSNTNRILFGEEAFMHLHIWQPAIRKKGMGVQFLKMTLPYFFENLQLQNLYCEPYALNPAPNKTLEKAGFEFVKEYITVPGTLNFEQPVKQWLMTAERMRQL